MISNGHYSRIDNNKLINNSLPTDITILYMLNDSD